MADQEERTKACWYLNPGRIFWRISKDIVKGMLVSWGGYSQAGENILKDIQGHCQRHVGILRRIFSRGLRIATHASPDIGGSFEVASLDFIYIYLSPETWNLYWRQGLVWKLLYKFLKSKFHLLQCPRISPKANWTYLHMKSTFWWCLIRTLQNTFKTFWGDVWSKRQHLVPLCRK